MVEHWSEKPLVILQSMKQRIIRVYGGEGFTSSNEIVTQILVTSNRMIYEYSKIDG